MSDGKFTPGPWTFGRDLTYEFGEWEIDYPHSCSYRHVGSVARPDAPVALVTGLLSREADVEIDANAALIAAAPDLYEALKEMLDEAVTAVLADPVLGPELDKLSSRLGQRFTSAVMGPQDEITCAQLMHAEAQRALAHIMILSAKVSEEKWRSRLAAQCGHTLALISAGQALLAVVNDSVESGKHWDERKALHEAIRSASEPSIAKPADGAT